MSDAQARGSAPQRKGERYLQIERRCKDLIVYANIMVKQFPKREKYALAARIMELCYDLLTLAITTGKRLHKKTTLTDMNVKHEVLRQLVNVAFELRYIDTKKHRTISTIIDEVGRMMGGWIRTELAGA